jgi:hypothetical protein
MNFIQEMSRNLLKIVLIVKVQPAVIPKLILKLTSNRGRGKLDATHWRGRRRRVCSGGRRRRRGGRRRRRFFFEPLPDFDIVNIKFGVTG